MNQSRKQLQIANKNCKLLEETKSTTKAIDALEESNFQIKALQLMNKNGKMYSSLIRPLAKLLVPTNASQFGLNDDPDSNNWIDYKMNKEKVSIYDDKIVLQNSGKILTLRSGVLKMITYYNFKTTDSPDAKLIINFTDEMHFIIHSRGKRECWTDEKIFVVSRSGEC